MKKMSTSFLSVLIAIAIGLSVSFKSDFFEIAKQIEIYTTLFKELNLYYIDEINPAEVMERSIKQTLEDLDPYTQFYDEQGVIQARIVAEGEYGGIGAAILYKEEFLLVLEVLENYPAHKAGIIAGDRLLQINDTEVKDHEESIIMGMLNGNPNSELSVVVERQGALMDFKLIRERVEINPVPFYTMIDENIGYIAFTKFNRKASTEVKLAYDNLVTEGMNKLIIDVRGNPGGLLNEAIEIVNFFIPKNEVVVTTKAKLDKWSLDYKTKKDPIDLELPIAILIDDRSASASEILAGALQDYDRAAILGQRSFGKGLVQRSRELSYGTQLKLTISKYYTPSGRCIQELDYTNRVGDSIPKFSDGVVNAFKTQNGRVVYDGGGVTPDLTVAKTKTSKITEELYRANGFFDYTTSFYLSNPSITNASDFRIEPDEFEKLKQYLKEKPESFVLKSELALMESFGDLEYNTIAVRKEFQQIEERLHEQKLEELDQNKEEILEKLALSIVKRYYFKKGEFEYKLANDQTIAQAVSVLSDENKFASLLNK